MTSASGTYPRLAVIGGSGFYEFLETPTDVVVSTPTATPSAPVAVGDVGGQPVAFLPRHGTEPRVPAAQDQLPREHCGGSRSLGVQQVLAPCAVGGLCPETQPGYPWWCPTSG